MLIRAMRSATNLNSPVVRCGLAVFSGMTVLFLLATTVLLCLQYNVQVIKVAWLTLIVFQLTLTGLIAVWNPPPLWEENSPQHKTVMRFAHPTLVGLLAVFDILMVLLIGLYVYNGSTQIIRDLVTSLLFLFGMASAVLAVFTPMIGWRSMAPVRVVGFLGGISWMIRRGFLRARRTCMVKNSSPQKR